METCSKRVYRLLIRPLSREAQLQLFELFRWFTPLKTSYNLAILFEILFSPLLVWIWYWSESELSSSVSVAASGCNSFLAVLFKNLRHSRFKGGWSWVREERCVASCPRFRFRSRALECLWRSCGLCDALIRSVFWAGEGNELTHFSALENVTCWRGE